MRHNSTNTVVCRVQGEWNGVLEFSYTSGETKLVDVTKLPVTKKRVRPIEKQGPTESRSEQWRDFLYNVAGPESKAWVFCVFLPIKKFLCVSGACGRM